MSDLTALFFSCFHRTVGLAFLGVQISIVTRCINEILLLQFFGRSGVLSEGTVRSKDNFGFIRVAEVIFHQENTRHRIDLAVEHITFHHFFHDVSHPLDILTMGFPSFFAYAPSIKCLSGDTECI